MHFFSIRIALRLVLICSIAPICACALTSMGVEANAARTEGQQGTGKKLENPIACKPSKEGTRRTFQQLADEANKHSFADILAGDTAAVCNIEEIFEVTSQTELKERIASILMRIGVTDSVYFNFLGGQAEKALQGDTPWVEIFDPKTGKVTGISPAFEAWCKKHNLDPRQEFENIRYKVPLPWLYLASAGDQRAFNIFLKGLHAENKMIVGYAALGLAKLQNSSAIDPLIAAASETTIGVKYQIAQALWFFNAPKAQTAGDSLAQPFIGEAAGRLKENVPLPTLKNEIIKGGPARILAFDGLLPLDSPLIAR
jgi:hypothetical protein